MWNILAQLRLKTVKAIKTATMDHPGKLIMGKTMSATSIEAVQLRQTL
ncbi:hypothetical protein HQ531_01495 [bacterium]|nr:hypothetical protein [bacterium]